MEIGGRDCGGRRKGRKGLEEDREKREKKFSMPVSKTKKVLRTGGKTQRFLVQ